LWTRMGGHIESYNEDKDDSHHASLILVERQQTMLMKERGVSMR
jgi:hypothetical protein